VLVGLGVVLISYTHVDFKQLFKMKHTHIHKYIHVWMHTKPDFKHTVIFICLLCNTVFTYHVAVSSNAQWNQMRIKNIKFNAKNTTAATCYNSNIFGCYIVATY